MTNMRMLAIVATVVAGTFACVIAASIPAEDEPLSSTFTNWLNHPAIEYPAQTTTDPIAELDARVKNGKASLEYDATSGYLRSLLSSLNVPIDSQIAVFARDSVQAQRISRHNPRTIFFNDSIAIGWVRGGFIEIAAQDPQQGTVFYTVDRNLNGNAIFKRRNDCLTCHYSYSTAGVPGMLVRSAGQFKVDHRVPLDKRWGGWYVTGRLGSIQHLGNLDIDAQYDAPDLQQDNLNWTSFDREFDTTNYVTSQSDVAALMIFEHQMHMMNLLTRIGWEVRVAEYHKRSNTKPDEAPIPVDEAAKEVVDYMLFVDEAKIDNRIAGSTDFAAHFAKQGPHDGKGRSLRQLRLDGRLMQYPCSYMIYSAQFERLPERARFAIYARLWRILSGDDKTQKYERLGQRNRVAIVEILRDTKRDLPPYFDARLVK